VIVLELRLLRGRKRLVVGRFFRLFLLRLTDAIQVAGIVGAGVANGEHQVERLILALDPGRIFIR
jgi:hypothetical protein